MRRFSWLVALACLAGCGRVGIDRLGDGALGQDVPRRDGAVLPRDGRAAGDGDTARSVAQISAASAHSCLRDAAGTVFGWGNGEAAAGLAPIRARQPTPAMLGLAGRAGDVACVHAFGCARVGDALECWGENSVGQLGRGTTGGVHDPAPTISIGAVESFALGPHHACAIAATRASGAGARTRKVSSVSPTFPAKRTPRRRGE